MEEKNARVDERKDRWLEEWVDGRIAGWMKKSVWVGRIGGWEGRWKDEWKG